MRYHEPNIGMAKAATKHANMMKKTVLFMDWPNLVFGHYFHYKH